MRSGILGLLLVASVAQAAEPTGLVAVLPLAATSEVKPNLVLTLEETIRTEAGSLLTPRGFTVLSGDNTLSILAENDIDAAKACDASCSLQAARELKASLFVSGSITFGEGVYVANVRLYEVKSGKQLGAVALEGPEVRVLRSKFIDRAPELFSSVSGTSVSSVREREEAAVDGPVTSTGGDEWETVTFASEPPGAIVRLAEFPGQTKQPLANESVVRWRLPSNRTYSVSMELPLYKPKTMSFRVTRTNKKIVVPLEPSFGTLSVVPVPADAQILINEESRGTGALQNWRVLAGESLELTVTHPCFYEYRKRGIRLDIGEAREEPVTLRPKLARVEIVLTNPKGEVIGGTLFADGVKLGATDDKHDVSICAKELKVQPDDSTLSAWTQAVTLSESKPAVFEVKVDDLAYVQQKQEEEAADSTEIENERDGFYVQVAYARGQDGTGLAYAAVIQPFDWLERSLHFGFSGLAVHPESRTFEGEVLGHSMGGFIGYQWWLNQYFVPYSRLHLGWDINKSDLTFLGEAGATLYPFKYGYLYAGGGYSTLLGFHASGGVGMSWEAVLAVFSAFSDARLKRDIVTLPGSRYACLGLQEVTWTWNDDARAFGLEGSGRGVLAQDVLAKLPEAVVTRTDGYLMVRYELLERRERQCAAE